MEKAEKIEVTNQKMIIEMKQVWNDERNDYIDVTYEYENIRGHQVGANWVAVFTEDNKTICLPAVDIKRILVSQE